MISKLDVRQLRKMKAQIAAFKRGELNLGSFIGNMDFLLNAIEDMPLEWKQRVNEFVGVLEEVYGVMLDRGYIEVDQQGQQFIDEATEGICNCLEEIKIPELLNESE